ncbi:MAG TPA: beta-ketoacyl-[acyl-carrier-protein] synthase family protein [Symbiobacteriaceae bacterium]|nr:beta-ketoacyl-[acyl-carrier-protein] synthase family protein [Symbiobacteriaceae bacterium]
MRADRDRIVVTGLGVVAGNGVDREAFCEAIYEGKTGIRPVTRFDVSQFRTPVAGQVEVEVPKVTPRDNQFGGTVSLAVRALNEALADAGLTAEQIATLGPRAGLAFSTSHGGTAYVMEHIKQELDQTEPTPDWLFEHSYFTNRVALAAGIQGPCSTTSSACAAGTASVGFAIDMIRSGRADLMVWGGSDPLMEISYGGFHIMKALSPTGVPKPFDKNRDGLIIGEGAAMMIVERLDQALARGAHIYAEIAGYGLSNDAYHATSPDPEGGGALRAMEMALADAGLQVSEIDYINAHGTATPANDTMEAKAIHRLLGDRAGQVAISSTKSMTGHCLGAAGSVEAAVCLLAIDRGFLPPTATLAEPEAGAEGLNLIKTQGRRATVKVALSNSFAFAGNTACIAFRQYQ